MLCNEGMMGQIEEKTSSVKMGKSSSATKKASAKSSKTKRLSSEPINFCDPKVQGVLLVGLLVILAIALWFGFKNGCIGRRRRRRRQSCC